MSLRDQTWFLVNALPARFVAANVAVWFYATPVGFQRFGSIGVLVAVAMFGLDRMSRMRRGRPARVSDELMLTELSLVSLSTFQWGYGDLFHCWTSGHGWQTC